MRIDILTLFPQMFQSVLGSSILKRACETVVHPDDPSRQRPPVVSYHLHDIRSYSTDKHQKVDRPPYGGGPGMVIQCQPVWDAVQAVEALVSEPALRIFLSPEGRRLDQTLVEKLAGEQRLLLIVGHYEGIDQRVVDRLAPLEAISIGDYVLTGGELAAMVLIDAVSRFIDGVVGSQENVLEDSITSGLLQHPLYTRPADFREFSVPEILRSGNHGAIERWRRHQSLRITLEKRPDLLAKADLTSNDLAFLQSLGWASPNSQD